MKITVPLLMLVCFVHLAFGADHPREVTKSSAKRFNVEDEIKAFYLRLLESDAAIKEQFESLTAGSHDTNGGIFYAFEPHVVEWFPRESSWNVSEGFDTDENYLVIQPVGYGRGRHAGHDSAVVSEFHVVHSGKTTYDESQKKPEPKLISNKITITFLGFRQLRLTPIKPTK